MKILTDRKLITCIVPKGRAIDIVRLLHEEKNINTANVSSGRGRGVVEPPGFKGWYEVDILTVVIGRDEADETFQFIYDKADICRPHGGIIYQGGLTCATEFMLPEVPKEGMENVK